MGNYVKTPCVLQMEAAECGAASLAMILAYFGKRIPLEALRAETGVSRDGCSAGDLMRAARSFGLECGGFRKKAGDLRTIVTPCIIHWDNDHFVVFEGFKGRRPYINDPASGRRRLTFEELEAGFSGTVLTFKPCPGFRGDCGKKDAAGRFARRRVMSERAAMVKLILIGVPLTLSVSATPVLYRILIDILAAKSADNFPLIIASVCAAVLLQAVLTLVVGRVLARLKKKTELLSARELLTKLFRLPMSFFEQRYAGDICSRVSANADVCGFLSDAPVRAALGILSAVCSLALLPFYSPVLTAAAVAAVILNTAVGAISSNIIADRAAKLRRDEGRLSGTVCAGVEIADTIKISGADNEYASELLRLSAEASETERRLSRARRISAAAVDGIGLFFDTLILFLGGFLVISGDMTIGGLTAFLLLFGALSASAKALTELLSEKRAFEADISRVEDMLNYPADGKFDGSAEKADITAKLRGTVELKNVTFGYSRLAPPVIPGLDIKLGCGSSLAIVGASGCGSSTVVKIMSGLYEPWEGEVLFDGIPAGNIPNSVLCASVSSVSQEITLFSGTIRDNITMWNSKISEEDMIAAAKDACIHDVITRKPGGYDYRLTEDGSNLSGGQRQRLGIARALAVNPTVLIMDEATSALDPILEKQIMENIKRRGCTCVTASHRLSAVRGCGVIAVMENGRVIQRGTHDELIKTEGLYKTLIRNS